MATQAQFKEIEAALVLSQLDLSRRGEAVELFIKGMSLKNIFREWKEKSCPDVLTVLE